MRNRVPENIRVKKVVNGFRTQTVKFENNLGDAWFHSSGRFIRPSSLIGRDPVTHNPVHATTGRVARVVQTCLGCVRATLHVEKKRVCVVIVDRRRRLCVLTYLNSIDYTSSASVLYPASLS